jgi:hypothetical protein
MISDDTVPMSQTHLLTHTVNHVFTEDINRIQPSDTDENKSKQQNNHHDANLFPDMWTPNVDAYPTLNVGATQLQNVFASAGVLVGLP